MWERQKSTFLEEPSVQTQWCLTQLVEISIKISTKINLLKLGFHFKFFSMFSLFFTRDFMICSLQAIFPLSLTFKQLLGNHVKSSDSQMTFKSMFRAVWNNISCYLIIIWNFQCYSFLVLSGTELTASFQRHNIAQNHAENIFLISCDGEWAPI